MATLETAMETGFHAVLAAPGRAAEIPAADDVYGWLIGSWELDVRFYWVDVSDRHIKGEAHFGWVLEGRAVQDVWISPTPEERAGEFDKAVNTYGTTLRVWDPAIQAWRVTWINPATNQRAELIGRRVGEEIVQIGTRGDGTAIRWIFTEITPDSFRWIGESLEPDGRTWKLGGEYWAKRVG
jgi:hypothetical protein